MKNLKLLGALLLVVMLIGSMALAVSKNILAPHFLLSKVKVKVGTTQYLSSIIEGPNINIDNLESSDTGVIKILENGNLKAVGTGISTITYTYKDENGDNKEIYCFVEVTRDESTYAEVTGVTSMKIYLSLELDGTTIIMESNKGAIPTFPEFKKGELVFDGWYKDAEYTNKVGERDRFGIDTTLYARWLTKEEAELKNKKVFTSDLYDDTNNHWAKIAIEAVSNLGWFNGVAERQFGPDVVMTRAMAVAVIGRIEGADVTGKESKIADVKAGSYYDGYLTWALENGIVQDAENGFRPNDVITREEIANYMANYIKYKEYKITLPLEASFTDLDGLSEQTKQNIKILYNLGIMQGTEANVFSPKGETTRAQMAQIFYNYYNYSMKNR